VEYNDDGLTARRGLAADLPAISGKNGTHDVADDFVVVGYEDTEWRHSSSSLQGDGIIFDRKGDGLTLSL